MTIYQNDDLICWIDSDTSDAMFLIGSLRYCLLDYHGGISQRAPTFSTILSGLDL